MRPPQFAGESLDEAHDSGLTTAASMRPPQFAGESDGIGGLFWCGVMALQ